MRLYYMLMNVYQYQNWMIVVRTNRIEMIRKIDLFIKNIEKTKIDENNVRYLCLAIQSHIPMDHSVLLESILEKIVERKNELTNELTSFHTLTKRSKETVARIPPNSGCAQVTLKYSRMNIRGYIMEYFTVSQVLFAKEAILKKNK